MMCADGLAKLIEECGELVQVCGKKLAYFNTNVHPDGGPPLDERLQDEMADVMAAITMVGINLGLDTRAIEVRAEVKTRLFARWHRETGNNEDAVDAPGRPR